VFAVAITLLVLSLEVPPDLSPARFREELNEELSQFLAYALSFGVVSVFWLAHHRAFMLVRRVDERLLALNLAFLSVIVLIPFPTQLLGEYGDQAPAVMLYGGTIAAAAFLSSALWWYASRHHRLIDPRTPTSYIRHASLRGAVVAVVFLASIPLALVSPQAPVYCWLIAFAARAVLARRFGSVHDVYRDPVSEGEEA
jgi:uncharacterized membrane protein